MWSKVWENYLSIPKPQRFNRWSLGMDMWFHPTLYIGCDYLSLRGLRSNHVSKRGPRPVCNPYTVGVHKAHTISYWYAHNNLITDWIQSRAWHQTVIKCYNRFICLNPLAVSYRQFIPRKCTRFVFVLFGNRCRSIVQLRLLLCEWNNHQQYWKTNQWDGTNICCISFHTQCQWLWRHDLFHQERNGM